MKKVLNCLKQNKKKSLSLKIVAISIFIILIAITFLTKYYGSTDIGDYKDVAKYFAGDFAAKIRSSHSYIYGLMLSPFVAIMHNFLIFKMTSLIFLSLIIYSVYYLTDRNKRAFWLMLASPIIWYMAPWISPIQISSLLFLWGYFFVKKFEKTEKSRYLVSSGILVGLSWIFWEAIIFFAFFLAISFLYNKKLYHSIFFVFALFIGLLPRLIIDQYLLGFAFAGIARFFSGAIVAFFYKGIYGSMFNPNILYLLILFFIIPVFTYKLFSKESLSKNKKASIFLLISFLFILFNPQIRYLLLLVPIIILELTPRLNPQQFRKLMVISIIISLLVIIPYEIQIKYSLNAEEITGFISNINHLQLSPYSNLLEKDLNSISKDFPNQVFIVGNEPDDFQILASAYWGKDIKELVSIQDYQLYTQNSTSIFEKKFMPTPRINDRRQIWIAGGISKNIQDSTNYSSISLGIGLNEPLNLTGFSQVKKYNLLYISQKMV